jgi:TetR/AcrR family fatty acid metabolism transcriptional regulator
LAVPSKNEHDRQRRSFIERARREQIVGAAVEVIVDVGYAQASLERIAQAAGISRGLISYHFAGRDDLVAELVLGVFRDGAEYMRPRIEAQPDAAAMLRAYLETNLAFLGEYRRQVLAVVAILSATGPQGPPGVDYRAVVEAPLDDLERILRWGQAAGLFRSFDSRIVATVVRSVIDGVPARLAFEPDLDLERYAAELVALFDRAVAKEPTP